MRTELQCRREVSRRRFIIAGGTALAAVMLGSCAGLSTGGSAPAVEPPDRRLRVRPGTPTLKARTGLSRLALGGARDGLIYVPSRQSRAKPAPLLVALHGSGGDCTQWDRYHEWAEARNLVLLAPESRERTWDGAYGRFGPDLQFLERAMGYAFDRWTIDPRRIALAGFSDGASYTLSLGVSNGDLFSNLIAHSPGFFAPGDPLVGTPRLFISHGRQDDVLPVTRSRDAFVPRFREAGYEVRYEEFEGIHEVPAQVAIDALDWFLGKPRRA